MTLLDEKIEYYQKLVNSNIQLLDGNDDSKITFNGKYVDICCEIIELNSKIDLLSTLDTNLVTIIRDKK